MTIKELKELIANMNDDDLVMIKTEEDCELVDDYWFNDITDDNGKEKEVIVLAL